MLQDNKIRTLSDNKSNVYKTCKNKIRENDESAYNTNT